ncbi:MAG: ArsI/CadI family heavy metal resistance metalloenzyme [Pirellula sp.]
MSNNLKIPTVVPGVRFHISLNVTNLDKSIRFYEILFDRPAAKRRDDYAKFEVDDPPLVLSLEPNGRAGGGTLNHLGLRLVTPRQLVAAQERLERSGIRSTREEGVECCYAKQTKFWVHDPDNTLWEFYTLDDDNLEHRGAGQSQEAMSSSTLPEDATVWEHRLGSPIPARIDACDNSVDEVRLRGSFNLPMTVEDRQRLMSESVRVLKPGGRLLIRTLSGEKEHASPNLTGPGSVVKFVPSKDELMQIVSSSSLSGLRLLKYDDPPCFVHDGIAMRETHIESFKQ